MVIKIAEYTVHKNETETVLETIRDFISAIEKNEPGTFYEAFRRRDSLEFVHLMKFPDEQAEKKHAKAPYTEKFVSILYPCCENQPEFTDLTKIE